MTSDDLPKNEGMEDAASGDLLGGLKTTSPQSGGDITYQENEAIAPDALADGTPPQKKDHRLGHRARMRDKVLNQGVNALADYELLEMLLYAAAPRGDTKPLAKTLIDHFGSLGGVMSASNDDLRKVENLSDAGIVTIRIAEKLGEKLLRVKVEKKNILSSWQALQEYCQAIMGRKDVEHFRILFLNNKNHLIADELQQTGTVNHTAVYPREVVKRALELGAVSLILVHNHPSGDTTPSRADIQMTEQIIKAAAALNIQVHDHLIVSRTESTSFKSKGLM